MHSSSHVLEILILHKDATDFCYLDSVPVPRGCIGLDEKEPSVTQSYFKPVAICIKTLGSRIFPLHWWIREPIQKWRTIWKLSLTHSSFLRIWWQLWPRGPVHSSFYVPLVTSLIWGVPVLSKCLTIKTQLLILHPLSQPILPQKALLWD